MKNNTGKKVNIRGFLTILGVTIGVASVILISAISDIGSEMIISEVDKFGIGTILISCDKDIYNKKSLTNKELSLIKKTKGTSSAVPVITNYSNASMRGLIAKVALVGMDKGKEQAIPMELIYGRFLMQDDVQLNKAVCIVDENMAIDYYKRGNIVGKEVEFIINGVPKKCEIVGVVKSGGTISQMVLSSFAPYIAYLPYTTLQQSIGKTDFNQIAVKVEKNENIKSYIDNTINSLQVMNNFKTTYSANTMDKQRNELMNILDLVKMILSSIAGVSLIVSGLSIMTVMLINVKERTKEIGIKKAVGAKKIDIMKEFLIDTIKIASIGELIGCCVAIIPIYIGKTILNIEVNLNYVGILQILAITLAIGIIFGVYPAVIASTMQPIKALQNE